MYEKDFLFKLFPDCTRIFRDVESHSMVSRIADNQLIIVTYVGNSIWAVKSILCCRLRDRGKIRLANDAYRIRSITNTIIKTR
mgnify:CR=1